MQTILDVPELTRLLKLKSPRTVRRYLHRGLIEARKVGGRWLVSESALARFMDGPDTRKERG